MIQVKNPKLFSETAIMITEDEGGGTMTRYIQPLDFFGDGTRIPMLITSPWSKGVGMVHSYGDHVPFAKFVEANWGLPTIAKNTRDNLPGTRGRRENRTPGQRARDQRHDGRVQLPPRRPPVQEFACKLQAVAELREITENTTAGAEHRPGRCAGS